MYPWDVIFLQEAAAVFIDQMGATQLSERYHIFSPEKIDAKRDQNSVILVSKARFEVQAEQSAKVGLPCIYMHMVLAGHVALCISYHVTSRSYHQMPYHAPRTFSQVSSTK